jgi:hypothetical protein|tara:strand:+ start:121 stop:396 length:276 start_codon:yes stop_codon:yes gene_type:complete
MLYVFWDSFELSNPLVEPMALVDLTDFEARLLKWISASDFVEVAWSTKRAAEAFNVNEKEVYEALASLTVKAKDYIQIFYDGGSIRIVADY